MPQQTGLNPGPPAIKHLRYEFSRLATLRNLVVAAIIALGCVATVFIVGNYSDKQPGSTRFAVSSQRGNVLSPNIPHPSAGRTAPAMSRAAYDLILPTPEILAQLPPNTEPVIHVVPKSLKGAARDKYISDLISPLKNPSPWAKYNPDGIRATMESPDGDVIEPCPSIAVERDKSWSHVVAFSSDGKHRYHVYGFKYACGHRVETTPDPYRDLMYADPAAVEREYAARLCPDCQSMRDYQEVKAISDDATHEPAAKQDGRG